MKPENIRRVLCVRNTGYEASLELRKIYFVLPDHGAERLGQLRVVDESGDDYLFPQDFFVSIDPMNPDIRSLIDAA